MNLVCVRCSKTSLQGSRKPFSIRSSHFFLFDMIIENLMPKGELQAMRIGYARVSTRDQNLERSWLEAARCARACRRSKAPDDRQQGSGGEKATGKAARHHRRWHTAWAYRSLRYIAGCRPPHGRKGLAVGGGPFSENAYHDGVPAWLPNGLKTRSTREHFMVCEPRCR